MDYEIYVHHGQVLRELINNYGVSVNELANFLSTSRQNIYNIYGIKVIKKEKLEQINRFFASKFANYNPSVFEVGIDLASNDSNNPVKKVIAMLEENLKRYQEELAIYKSDKEYLKTEIERYRKREDENKLVLTKLDRLERLNFGVNEGGGLGKIEDLQLVVSKC